MSPVSRPSRRCVLSFPRVSGDEPIVKGYITYAMGFSPRERG